MRRSFKFLSVAGLLVAVALSLNARPSCAAEADADRREVPRDLATAYDAVYDLSFRASRATKDPNVRNRNARQRAVDAVVGVVGDGRTAKSGNTPAEQAAGKAAAEALKAGPPGFQNARVLFAYRDAYLAAREAPGEDQATSSESTAIAARAVARAVSQLPPSEKSSNATDSAAESADDKPTPRDQNKAAYAAAYKAVYRILDTDSKATEYEKCMVAYEAAKNQLVKDHVQWNPPLVEGLAIKALFDAARDRYAKQPHVPR